MERGNNDMFIMGYNILYVSILSGVLLQWDLVTGGHCRYNNVKNNLLNRIIHNVGIIILKII